MEIYRIWKRSTTFFKAFRKWFHSDIIIFSGYNFSWTLLASSYSRGPEIKLLNYIICLRKTRPLRQIWFEVIQKRGLGSISRLQCERNGSSLLKIYAFSVVTALPIDILNQTTVRIRLIIRIISKFRVYHSVLPDIINQLWLLQTSSTCTYKIYI